MKYFSLAAIALLFGCSQPGNVFQDEHLQQVAEWQDRRETDSLVLYLTHAEARYRERAALALASVQDSAAALPLGNVLLDDKDAQVRAAAAFALGQTRGFQPANALIPALTDADPMVRREALEALGKTIRKEDLGVLIAFQPADSLAEEGLAWGIYRLGVRGLLDSALLKKTMLLLTSSGSTQARLGAAHTLSRGLYKPFNGMLQQIQKAVESSSVEVRMALANGLRNFNGEESLLLLTLLIEDDDYRVRVNAVRSLRAFAWEAAAPHLQGAVRDANAHVAVAAAEVVRAMIRKDDATTVWQWANELTNQRAQAILFEAVLKAEPLTERADKVKAMCQASNDSYHTAWLLTALAQDPSQAAFIHQTLLASKAPVVQSTASEALVRINRNPQFKKEWRAQFAEYYRTAIATGDAGVILHACEALKDSTLGYKEMIIDYQFLKDARQQLSLPRDLEAIQPLDEAIAYFEGKPLSKLNLPAFNHPINWDSVKLISSEQKVQIETTRGNIELLLLVNEAPGSVLNFVQLTRKQYFDGRFIHRVVPNFVVQTGCKRGDGYGSEDYSIRSEFSRRRYTTGSVGMASAGKDTEGTQWFITHSPTPHLDGGYTIFAEVTAGLDVLHTLQVGDQIVRVSLTDN